jgi:transaldolase
MKIFLDTADLGEIEWAAEAGLIDGITTNPSLIAKVAGEGSPTDLLQEICRKVDGPVSALAACASEPPFTEWSTDTTLAVHQLFQ